MSVKASVLKKRVIIQMDYYPFFVCTVTPEPIALLDVRGTSAQQRPERSGEATSRENICYICSGILLRRRFLLCKWLRRIRFNARLRNRFCEDVSTATTMVWTRVCKHLSCDDVWLIVGTRLTTNDANL